MVLAQLKMLVKVLSLLIILTLMDAQLVIKLKKMTTNVKPIASALKKYAVMMVTEMIV